MVYFILHSQIHIPIPFPLGLESESDFVQCEKFHLL